MGSYHDPEELGEIFGKILKRTSYPRFFFYLVCAILVGCVFYMLYF